MSILSGITKGKQEKPFRAVVYGPEGCGKSTFAASAPGSIIVDTEGGTSFLDCSRTPRAESFADVMKYLDALATESHDFKTVAVDTLDALEPLVYKAIIAEANSPKIQNVEDFGYGKGYVAAADKWRLFLSVLDKIATKGVNVVLLAHSTVKNFKSPDITVEAYDRYELKLHKTASALIKEWPDFLGFAQYEVATAEKDGKNKGISTGRRIIQTTHSAAWDAKNRYGLPPTIELNWQAFETAARASAAVSVEKVKAEITAVLKKKDVRTAEKAMEALARAGEDLQKLTQLLAWTKEQN